jgi:high-affinity iron transporter
MKSDRRVLLVACGVVMVAVFNLPGSGLRIFASDEPAKPARPERALSRSDGKALYDRYCAVCHGQGGDGKGSAAALIEGVKPKNFSDPEVMRESTPERFYQAITLGVPGTAMPEWGEILEPQGRWDVVAYLWSLRPVLPDVPSPQSCMACHGRKGPDDDLTEPGALAAWSDQDLAERAVATKEHGGIDNAAQMALVQVARLLELAADGASLASFERVQIPHMLDLLVDEYASGVENGEVVDALDYHVARAYQQQIADDIERVIGTGGIDSTTVRELSQKLDHAVAGKVPDGEVADLASRLKIAIALNLGT